MSADRRMDRRLVGTCSARLGELPIDAVPDPRGRPGLWSLRALLSAPLVGILAGCRSLAETEELTDDLSAPVRRRLGIARRVPDTTIRDVVVRIDPDDLRPVLHRQVRLAQRAYVMRLKDQPTLQAEARRLLGRATADEALARTEDVRGTTTVIRRVWATEDMAGFHGWDHLRTVIRVESEVRGADGCLLSVEQRWYVTSLPAGRLSGARWLRLIRSHWSVENHNHWVFDALLREDDRPWIQQPRGMLVVMLLRRIAYNIMALFRSVTQRSEERRRMPWRTLMRKATVALVAATEAQLAGLRPRRSAACI